MTSATTPPAPAKTRLGGSYWRLWTASVISNLGDGIALVAYPWLASAVTRNPALIALVAVAQRLPWLFFTLPAGVLTDRHDRRQLMVAMDAVRFGITAVVAVLVALSAADLPAPDEIDAGMVGDAPLLYAAVVVAAVLLGCAEVLRDNSAQTILPAIVKEEALERANGRLWGAEMVANALVGPPLGSLLIGITFALPFIVDAGTFAVAAAVVFAISGAFRAEGRPQASEPIAWRTEIGEGVRWLWHHELLRPMAIALGALNALGMMTMATLVLFAQEILDADAFRFALIGTGGAIGGVIGSLVAARVSQKLGSGPSLQLAMLGIAATTTVVGFVSVWPLVWLMLAITMALGVLWNVITVSLRQTIIPDRLLGRVNSVYRFFGWGMMPVGSAFGGLVVLLVDLFAGREMALRAPWIVAGVLGIVVYAYAAPRLTTAKIEASREAAREAT